MLSCLKHIYKTKWSIFLSESDLWFCAEAEVFWTDRNFSSPSAGWWNMKSFLKSVCVRVMNEAVVSEAEWIPTLCFRGKSWNHWRQRRGTTLHIIQTQTPDFTPSWVTLALLSVTINNQCDQFITCWVFEQSFNYWIHVFMFYCISWWYFWLYK